MLLFITHGIPPNIQQPLTPLGSLDKETSQIESTTILGHNEVDALLFVIAHGGLGNSVEEEEFVFRGRVLDFKGVVDIDVAVRIVG